MQDEIQIMKGIMVGSGVTVGDVPQRDLVLSIRGGRKFFAFFKAEDLGEIEVFADAGKADALAVESAEAV